MVLSVQKNYVSSSCNFRHGDYPNGGYCGNLNKFISSYSHLVCRTSRKRKKKKKEILVLNDSKSNGWEKIENINLECYSQIFEET